MKFAVAIIAILAIASMASAAPLTEDQHRFLFVKWAQQWGRRYEASELLPRYQQWKENMNMIVKHNEEHKAGKHSHTLAMNQFGDMSNAEHRSLFNGYKSRQNTYLRKQNLAPTKLNATLPATVDWVAAGAVTAVKDQGQCGSCWSFSSTGALEGAKFIATGSLISLSEQQLIDCSTAQGNQGCNGGMMDDAFQYVITAGSDTEADYPYTATGPNACQASQYTAVTHITGFKDVNPNDELALKAAVAQQPTSVAVCAQDGWQFYSGGVLTSCCTAIDHGVLAVGYGTDASTGQLYWKVKNSWASSWGESGYIRILRTETSGSAGMCAIATEPSYPTGAN